MKEGIVFEIARAAMNDGPGIRTTVFLKGCPLRCSWCHNPESQRFEIESGIDKEGNTVVYGRKMTADEVLEEVGKDLPFYRASGGGVTFSGGEPFAQPDFLEELCCRCKEEGISVCVDTSGCASENAVKRMIPYVDLFLLDYKQTGEEAYVRDTGMSGSQVIKMLELLQQAGKNVWLRCPIVPGYQDRREHFGAIAALERRFSCIRQVDLMFFHTLGHYKYCQLGITDPTEHIKPYSEEEKETLRKILQEEEAKNQNNSYKFT